mmetsp:Transcript_10119/g.15961  ORF Transcript_10119/g.15961 Transcript_10119/m.15961 type:complete len:248 (-) Transcript_10119:119-862(-)
MAGPEMDTAGVIEIGEDMVRDMGGRDMTGATEIGGEATAEIQAMIVTEAVGIPIGGMMAMSDTRVQEPGAGTTADTMIDITTDPEVTMKEDTMIMRNMDAGEAQATARTMATEETTAATVSTRRNTEGTAGTKDMVGGVTRIISHGNTRGAGRIENPERTLREVPGADITEMVPRIPRMVEQTSLMEGTDLRGTRGAAMDRRDQGETMEAAGVGVTTGTDMSARIILIRVRRGPYDGSQSIGLVPTH